MTLDEKIGQTVLFSAGWEVTGSTLDETFTTNNFDTQLVPIVIGRWMIIVDAGYLAET